MLTFGFLDEPDVPEALKLLPPAWHEEPLRTSYVLGRQVLVRRRQARHVALAGGPLRRNGPAVELRNGILPSATGPRRGARQPGRNLTR